MMLPTRGRKKPAAPNPEPRCPLLLLLDLSSSMLGSKGNALVSAVRQCVKETSEDKLASHRVELAIVTFGPGGVQVAMDFTPIAEVTDLPPFDFKGSTPLAGGILKSLDLLRERKAFYQAEGIDAPYRPWVVLITDGGPTDHGLIETARAALFKAVGEHRLTLYPVGVKGADFEFLKSITPAGSKTYELDAVEFSKFFMWLSRSITSASQEDPDEETEPAEPDGAKKV